MGYITPAETHSNPSYWTSPSTEMHPRIRSLSYSCDAVYFVLASPWMLVFRNSNWLQCGGLRKQVYGKKKIKPTSSINNCAIAVGLLPMHRSSASNIVHCFLRLSLYVHDCAMLRRSVWPEHSKHLMRQKTSRWTNMYKKWEEKWEEADNLPFRAPGVQRNITAFTVNVVYFRLQERHL